MLFSNLRFPDTAWKDRMELTRRMVLVYRQRFSIEDVFAWTKGALDWESVRVLDDQALRVVVAFSWIAAAFVFELSGEMDQQEVLLLAELGGDVGRNRQGSGRRPWAWSG
ncbi:hypothetical protein [Deinococcus peraridilitoris]|uniref:Uncharacterized protein n=1 Tax=Deinococcus peraridilitoris (strain DSM 19664 / LMG 22246 / CIP 109416 / KR-200) TaxID=937777 RepID=L0A9H2_DEIPD|nr:hypothetical protein [Deinococcus peraridilitoris]AFZ69695.1 hypothetical protein Deipe_4355 [Deinococcus peraridilitoris DSM 19664]